MPINTKPIVVFDLETLGLDWRSHDISQIAAIVLDPRTLDPLPNAEFVSYIKPLRPENADPGALRVTGLTLEMLSEAPSLDVVWSNFTEFINKYNFKKTKFSAPIPCGYNILSFDFKFLMPIMKKYGQWDDVRDEQKLFGWPPIDVMHLIWGWTESLGDLKSISMDALRQYFGIEEMGHDALVDVRTTARILKRFLAFQRSLAGKHKFKGAFAQTGDA